MYSRYEPNSLRSHFLNLTGVFYNTLLGEMEVSVVRRKLCSTLQEYDSFVWKFLLDHVYFTVITNLLKYLKISHVDSLYVKVSALGTGWVENWAFYEISETDRYVYPTSVAAGETDSCCYGVRCRNVPKVSSGTEFRLSKHILQGHFFHSKMKFL